MNSRERVTQALGHQQPDRLPKGFFATADSMELLRRFLNVDSNDQVLKELGIDLRHIEPLFVGPVERSGGLHCSANAHSDFWGVPRALVTNEYGTYSEIADHPLAGATSPADIQAYDWPRQEWFDTTSIAEQLARADDVEPRFINYHRAGKLFEVCWALRGMERFLMDMLEQPWLVEAMLQKVFDFYSQLAGRVISAGKGRIDMVTIGDDVGTQRGMMISPKLWQRIFKPYLGSLIRVFHRHNVKVMYHSCGSICPIIPDLIEIGVDILEPIQPRAEGMDAASLKEAYGDRLCFHGGVDEQNLLPFGTPQQVREEVLRLGRVMGRNGGYILMAAHAFQPDTPSENIVAMYEAADLCC